MSLFYKQRFRLEAFTTIKGYLGEILQNIKEFFHLRFCQLTPLLRLR